MQQHADVYFIQGSPLRQDDLMRCNIMQCAQLLILSSPSGSNINTIDATTVATVLNAKHFQCRVLADMHTLDNCSFLEGMELPMPKVDLDPYTFHTSYLSGCVFGRAMIDVLLCQSYYNPYLLSMLDQLLTSDKCIQRIVEQDAQFLFVYNKYLEKGMVCIGVVKREQYRGNAFDMVVANPKSDMPIQKGDRVFVLK